MYLRMLYLLTYLSMFNKKTLLCIDLLAAIASVPKGTVVTSLALAKGLSISLSHVESILRLLREAGFVLSIRGPGGGYYISCDPELINVWEVVNAIEGNEIAESPAACTNRVTATLENALASEVKLFLSKKTIRELVTSDSIWPVHAAPLRRGFCLGPKPASLMPVAPNSVFQLSSYLQGVLA